MQVGVFSSLRTRLEAISHTSLVLLEREDGWIQLKGLRDNQNKWEDGENMECTKSNWTCQSFLRKIALRGSHVKVGMFPRSVLFYVKWLSSRMPIHGQCRRNWNVTHFQALSLTDNRLPHISLLCQTGSPSELVVVFPTLHNFRGNELGNSQYNCLFSTCLLVFRLRTVWNREMPYRHYYLILL